ncbi:MAG: pantoate--beta-alanine ligase [Planctomycetota bacterium]|nr:pantoate--beta-alanine ligase [Planctomycetota bacterium]
MGGNLTVIRTADELESHRGGIVVPTMGALHAGHTALIQQAAARAKEIAPDGAMPVIVTVFVNPTQFNDRSDYDAYPRGLERDIDLAREAGAEVIFAPDESEVYPKDEKVEVPPLPPVATEPGLEDRFRPGHFQGVCQVVKRLFDFTKPREAIFGEKDWQQLQVIRAMTHAARLRIRILSGETIREPDGLALSSRNVRLSSDDRRRAAAIPAALRAAQSQRRPEAAEAAMGRALESAGGGLELEYAAVRDADTLMRIDEDSVSTGRSGRALIAAKVGGVRLIDNLQWPGASGAGEGETATYRARQRSPGTRTRTMKKQATLLYLWFDLVTTRSLARPQFGRAFCDLLTQLPSSLAPRWYFYDEPARQRVDPARLYEQLGSLWGERGSMVDLLWSGPVRGDMHLLTRRSPGEWCNSIHGAFEYPPLEQRGLREEITRLFRQLVNLAAPAQATICLCTSFRGGDWYSDFEPETIIWRGVPVRLGGGGVNVRLTCLPRPGGWINVIGPEYVALLGGADKIARGGLHRAWIDDGGRAWLQTAENPEDSHRPEVAASVERFIQSLDNQDVFCEYREVNSIPLTVEKQYLAPEFDRSEIRTPLR